MSKIDNANSDKLQKQTDDGKVDASKEKSIDALFSSESNDWFTPRVYIERVRRVIGDIDLDPASTPAANLVVQAHRIHTCEEDALQRHWKAESVFLNPPYGKVANASQAGLFCKYMAMEYEHECFPRGMLLVNSCTGAKWFKVLFEYPICFVDHRIRFDVPPLDIEDTGPTEVLAKILGRAPEKNWPKITEKLRGFTLDQLIKYYYSQNQPTKENVFVYMGKDRALFKEEFSEIGTVINV